MLSRIASLIRRTDRHTEGYSPDLQAARLRAAYQRAYFAPALFNLVPVRTDLIASMAVDTAWRLYYNDSWLATHTVEENAAVLIHEVGHLLRDHESRKKAAAARNERLWNTAADCEINDDLATEGLPLAGQPAAPAHVRIRDRRERRGVLQQAAPTARRPAAEHEAEPDCAARQQDCGSGAHGERRPWELPDDGETTGRYARRRCGEGRARSARGGAAHHGCLRLCRRHRDRLAAMGTRHPDAAGRLHGDHPADRAQSAARVHARAATIAPTGGRTAGRAATATSSCRRSISRGPARGSSSIPRARCRTRSWRARSRSSVG